MPMNISLCSPILKHNFVNAWGKCKCVNFIQLKNTDWKFYFQDEDIRNALEESCRIRDEFQKYFDLEIVVEDFDKTFRTIMESLEKLTNESQWVPLNWVYSWYLSLTTDYAELCMEAIHSFKVNISETAECYFETKSARYVQDGAWFLG